jgi:hypothetical protein
LAERAALPEQRGEEIAEVAIMSSWAASTTTE